MRLNVNPGSRIGEIAGELPVEKVAASTPRPVLQVFRDIETDTINESLTPGGAGELNGTHMKINAEDLQQCIFLIAANGMISGSGIQYPVPLSMTDYLNIIL